MHKVKPKSSEKKAIKLSDFETSPKGEIIDKIHTEKLLLENVETISMLQDMLYAQDKYALLIIFQAMDTAGKDGAIKHVMSGLNPQGTQVHNFKQPSAEEIDHDYLWRAHKNLPERGRIGIFNRSYYEEVLVVRVHDLIKNERIPEEFVHKNIWKDRFKQICDFERYLYENGTIILKFFLHISKEEQKKRLLERINNKSKNWKFSEADLNERKFWDDYQSAYQDAINGTNTDFAPWYIIPSDKKWYARLMISNTIIKTLKSLKLAYPKIDGAHKKMLKTYEEDLLKNE